MAGPPQQQHDIESLKPFFRPRAVAVVGASREPAGIGHRILESLQGSGFTGSVIPVNPHATKIAGLRAFPSLLAIPDPVDLAIIAARTPGRWGNCTLSAQPTMS